MKESQGGGEGKLVPKKGLGIRGTLIGLIATVVLTSVAASGLSLWFLSNQEQDAAVVNVAGRQRMLSQKMTKESLALAAGLDSDRNRRALAETVELFDRSHRGLIQGDDALGLPPTTRPDILAQMGVVDRLWEEMRPQLSILSSSSGQSPQADKALMRLLGQNLPLLTEMNKAVGLYEKAAKEKIVTLKRFLIAGAALSLLLTFLCARVITSRIVDPVRAMVEMLKSLEAGRLDRRLNFRRGDELGQMGRVMDAFADNLQQEILTAFDRLARGDFTFEARGLIREPLRQANDALNEAMSQVRGASERIASCATQVSDSAQTLSQGATEQASSLEQISASLHQLSAQTKHNADNALQANQLSNRAQRSAEEGNRQMQAMVQAMAEINTAGQNISRIIKTIDEIAFQTNLLALNAAVEAARAGAHGKGFAVVAEEVRSLAGRSAKAARETAELIEQAVEKTANGAQIADLTAEALGAIVQGITKASDLVGEIAAASREQAEGIGQVNLGLSQIGQVTQQNTATSEESAAASEELSGEAEQLREVVARFRLKGEGSGGETAAGAPARAFSRVLPPSHPAGEWGASPPAADPRPFIALSDSEFGRY